MSKVVTSSPRQSYSSTAANFAQPDATLFGTCGIPAQEVVPDTTAVFYQAQRPKGPSVHILTGPIYIEGTEPGDTL